jgi:hypothetical protein
MWKETADGLGLENRARWVRRSTKAILLDFEDGTDVNEVNPVWIPLMYVFNLEDYDSGFFQSTKVLFYWAKIQEWWPPPTGKDEYLERVEEAKRRKAEFEATRGAGRGAGRGEGRKKSLRGQTRLAQK